ncbi:S41 family peptidase, partial [uncultured Arthrobacter sp.]|uniref:S41 family peptidase n=1 Tax=uncultured Arthrobacter sp. TaxID=114050 RepID=UPI003217886F
MVNDMTTALTPELLLAGIRQTRLVAIVRGNDGGDSTIGFELARYLTKTELPPYAESRRLVRNVAAQPDLLKNLDTYSEDLKTNLRDGLPTNLFKPAENGFFEIVPNEKVTTFARVAPAENNFRGETFVIADAANASATFSFLKFVKANRLARIVGEESGGNLQGINGGNYYFLNLPNSKIEVDVPVYFFAPLAPQKDSAVVPDFRVQPTARDIAAGIDAELNFILKMIKRK